MRNQFIHTLSQEHQDKIKKALIDYYKSIEINEDEMPSLIDEVMSDRVWILEEGFPDLLLELNL